MAHYRPPFDLSDAVPRLDTARRQSEQGPLTWLRPRIPPNPTRIHVQHRLIRVREADTFDVGIDHNHVGRTVQRDSGAPSRSRVANRHRLGRSGHHDPIIDPRKRQRHQMRDSVKRSRCNPHIWLGRETLDDLLNATWGGSVCHRASVTAPGIAISGHPPTIRPQPRADDQHNANREHRPREHEPLPVQELTSVQAADSVCGSRW